MMREDEVSSMSEERVVVITGGASGLGAALALDFAARGFGVCINYVTAEKAQVVYEQAAQVADESRLMLYEADVADRAGVRAMFDAVVERFGRVDMLVNSAGQNRDASFLELTDEDWHAVISSHLHGHFVCSQEYALHNPDRPGVIVNLGAPCGELGRKNGANFCSAKGAILAFTKCLAQELGPRIRVNCLVPGSVQTREVIERYDLDTEEGVAKEVATMPLRRLGELEDVVHMVRCMVDAEFTTGANFYVDGGRTMC